MPFIPVRRGEDFWVGTHTGYPFTTLVFISDDQDSARNEYIDIQVSPLIIHIEEETIMCDVFTVFPKLVIFAYNPLSCKFKP